MKRLEHFAERLQHYTGRLQRKTLITLFVIGCALALGACYLVVHRALVQPSSLRSLFPLPPDSIRLK